MNYSNPKKYFALEDTAFFQAILKYTKDNANYEYIPGDATKGTLYNNKALVVKVADESIALISGNTGSKYTIKANQVGSTNVFIGYVDDNQKFITVAVAPIEVRAKRAAATMSVSASKSTLNDNAATQNDDSIKITILVKDQYGDPCNDQPAASQLTQSQDKKPVLAASLAAGATNWANPETGKFELTLDKTDFGAYASGTNNLASIVLNFKTSNGVTGTQSFSIADKAPAAGDAVAFGSNGAIDTSVVFTGNGDTTDTTVTLDVTTSNGGYYTGHVDMSAGYQEWDATNKVATAAAVFIAKGSSAPQAGCVTGAGFALEVLKGGQRINLSDAIASWDVTPFSTFIVPNYAKGTIKVTGLVNVGGILKKLPADSYTFRVYYIKDGLIKVLTSVVTVTDKQIAPTFEQIKQSSTNGTDVASCFKFKFNGVDLPSPAEGAYTTTVSAETKGGTFVKKVDVTFNVKLKNAGVTTAYTMAVDINKLLSK